MTERMDKLQVRLARSFQEPRSLKEARQRLDDLAMDMKGIDVQLGNRDRHDPVTGERMSEQDYWKWRSRATHAKLQKEVEYRQVKRWLIEHQVDDQAEAVGIDPADEHSLLFACYRTLRALAGSRLLAPDNLVLLAALRQHLENCPKEVGRAELA